MDKAIAVWEVFMYNPQQVGCLYTFPFSSEETAKQFIKDFMEETCKKSY